MPVSTVESSGKQAGGKQSGGCWYLHENDTLCRRPASSPTERTRERDSKAEPSYSQNRLQRQASKTIPAKGPRLNWVIMWYNLCSGIL